MLTGLTSNFFLHSKARYFLKDSMNIYFVEICSVFEKLRFFKDSKADLMIYRSGDFLAPLNLTCWVGRSRRPGLVYMDAFSKRFVFISLRYGFQICGFSNLSHRFSTVWT